MVRRPWFSSALVIATLLAAIAVDAGAQGLRPEASTIDAGAVVAGDTAVARFVLVNESQREIRILRAAPS
jgi:hypothetical protein